MWKFRLVASLLSFCVGGFAVNVFSPQRLIKTAIRDHVIQQIKELPPGVAATGTKGVSASAPTIESGFGGDGSSIAGNDQSFVVTTGNDSSFSGSVNFYMPYSSPPSCLIESDGPAYDLRYRVLSMGRDKPSSFVGVYVAVPGSHVPPHSKIYIRCMGHE